MRRNTTILLVGALVAILAISVIAPAAIAQADTEEQPTEPYPGEQYPAEQNATETQAQYIAEWMEMRMGPEGVESFEQRTGTTVDEVASAMAETMGPTDGSWYGPRDSQRYGPGTDQGYQTPGWGYGPMMPGGHGFAPGPWGGYGPGADYDTRGTYGPPGYGHGMGGHMSGHMGGGW